MPLFAAQSKVKKIYLAGIDGYEDQNKMKRSIYSLHFFKRNTKILEYIKSLPENLIL